MRLSMSCRPSARRERTRSVRLTLAGARSTRAAMEASGTSPAAGLPSLVLRRRGRILGKARFQLFLDPRQLLLLRLEVARMRPLEARLEQAPDPPIGIAQ